MPSTFLSETILIITAAFLGGFVARTVKLPPVLGYIVSGVIFGIIGRNFFESYDTLVTISQFGISLLLFTLGFEINIDELRKINKKIIAIGIFQVILCSIAIFPLLFLFGISFKTSILLSILFSFSSTAVVVKILEEKGLLNNFPGNNVFILLLVQDMFVVPVIFLLPVLFSKASFNLSLIPFFLIAAGKPLIIFVSIFLIGRLIFSRFVGFLFRYPSHELSILASIFTASISIFLFTVVGLPQSVAAFLAGLLISDQGKNLTPLSEIRPFRDLFLVLFFVITGMLLSADYFLSNLPAILIISLAAVLIKFFVTYFILRVFRHSPASSVFISSYISNIGEFTVVISQLAFISYFISQKEYNLALSVFILGLVLISPAIKYSRTLTEALARFGILGKIADDYQVAGEGIHKFQDHVVICGHGRVGREVRSLLELASIPYVIIDFNRKVINELISASKYAIYGDPTDEEILKAAFIENARVLVIAVPDTFSQKKIINLTLKLNPKITIMCRSHIEEDRYDLINMGVNSIIMPELEAGLQLGIEVLDIFNIRQEDTKSFVARLRRQHLL